MGSPDVQGGTSLAGRLLGRYRLLELLGTGGMSVVYRGLDTALQREVAVKILHPHLALHQDARRRLEREARAVARLHHANILEVFDVASPDLADAFLVTELVRGETLRSFAERERFWPPELGAAAVHAIASALAHAHRAGVVHRDLKPENVMLREDGVLKLMDFGIARVLDPAERMTQTGALVGSPAYMAPEVIEGEAAGPEADVFALGTLLFWLWTGELPFSGPTTPATLKRILEGHHPDPRERTPALSDALADILDRCLKRDPAERFPNAEALEAALGEALAEAGLPDPAAELAAFHAHPAGMRQRLVERLADRLGAEAEAALSSGRTALALRRVDQLLGLRPEDPVGRSVLARAQRVDRVRRRRRGALAAAGLLAAAGMVLWGGLSALRAWHGAPRPAAPPAEVAQALATPSAPAGEAPAPARAEPAAPAAPERKPARPETVPVELLVRPYGYVQVDQGPRSREPLAAHALVLSPGRHTVRISCQWCDPADHVIEVAPGAPRSFALAARLKTGYLSFDFQPRDALVTVAGEGKTAEQTLTRPFALFSPVAPTRFVHRVQYVVSRPGYREVHGTAEVLPGQQQTVSGRLDAR